LSGLYILILELLCADKDFSRIGETFFFITVAIVLKGMGNRRKGDYRRQDGKKNVPKGPQKLPISREKEFPQVPEKR
jgi:hypothetical protein